MTKKQTALILISSLILNAVSFLIFKYHNIDNNEHDDIFVVLLNFIKFFIVVSSFIFAFISFALLWITIYKKLNK